MNESNNTGIFEIRHREFPNRRVFRTAFEFHSAAILLRNESGVQVADIVNAALALELYLKSLNAELCFFNGERDASGVVTYETVKILATGSRSHEPLKLFEALPSETQRYLSGQFGSAFPREQQELASVLDSYQRLFVDWRYIFEASAQTVNVTLLFQVLDFFKHNISALIASAQKAGNET